MTPAEIIGVVIATLTILGSLVLVWNQTQLKIKQMETDILGIKAQIAEMKIDRIEIIKLIEKNNDAVIARLDKLDQKLDKQFEEITILKTEHNQRVNCYYEKKIKNLDKDV